MENLIDVLMPLCIALLTIYISEMNTRKRDMQYKKIQLKLQFLNEVLQMIKDTENMVYLISRKLGKCLMLDNPGKRTEFFVREISPEISGLIEKVTINTQLYIEVNITLDIDLCLKDFESSVGNFNVDMRNIYNKYNKARTDGNEDFDEINLSTTRTIESLHKSVKYIAKEMNSIIN